MQYAKALLREKTRIAKVNKLIVLFYLKMELQEYWYL